MFLRSVQVHEQKSLVVEEITWEGGMPSYPLVRNVPSKVARALISDYTICVIAETALLYVTVCCIY